jgi:hypothetical protein
MKAMKRSNNRQEFIKSKETSQVFFYIVQLCLFIFHFHYITSNYTAITCVDNKQKFIKSKEINYTKGQVFFYYKQVRVLNRLLDSKSNEIELLKETTTYRLEKERTKNSALKREIELLKKGRSSQQTVIQSTGSMDHVTSPVNVGSSYHDDSDDSNNDLNYDSD